MKNILIVIVIIGLGYFGWQAIQTKPDPSVPEAVVGDVATVPPTDEATPPGETGSAGRVRPVDNENVKITFKGFGPGKEHTGSFGTLSSDLSLDETGSMSGTVTVTVSSLVSDTEKLTSHLKSKDFFDVAVYPTATFTLSGIADGRASGSMTIRGITKAVSFPVSYSDATNAYSAKFTLNMKDFGINQTFANEVIELGVTVPLR
jgi:polyisoprenoid-binding protein YceI